MLLLFFLMDTNKDMMLPLETDGITKHDILKEREAF